ncbi:glutaminyl-peptide cyclotransferase [Pedobacter metabolipauper]|uniref:Glutamine cyclotransferase n=1 Tax=Pedobacter metabolipauper TaxID=425513 RepID=A0A4R6T3F2_9SPHI|nr:glutaminyl-peptide cyclotransferase [Pedobacter metabolipauper]TDQ11901.1 glutamine cyclotransferase [Pedobacter metabolipauper]
MKRLLLFSIILFLGLQSCTDQRSTTDTGTVVLPQPKAIPNLAYEVKATLPHDKSLFTEGLFFHDGQLFESTGSPEDIAESKSMVGIMNTETGVFSAKAELDKSVYFGEGSVIFNDKLYQLTYKNQKGFIYDAKTFKKTGEFRYANLEGWGLTTDSTNLIMSDGTNKLTFINPATMQPVKSLSVLENDTPVDRLNELEYIKGYIYANVWLTNTIVKIDPATGKLVGKLDIGPVFFTEKSKNIAGMELNGIAYLPKTDRIYITGKLWSTIYEIELKSAQ